DAGVAIAVGQIDRVDRFGEGPDLIDLDQDAVGNPFVDAAPQPLDVGYEQIVPYKLALAADLVGEQLPASPIVFAAAILDAANGELVDPARQQFDHAGGVEFLAVDRV